MKQNYNFHVSGQFKNKVTAPLYKTLFQKIIIDNINLLQFCVYALSKHFWISWLYQSVSRNEDGCVVQKFCIHLMKIVVTLMCAKAWMQTKCDLECNTAPHTHCNLKEGNNCRIKVFSVILDVELSFYLFFEHKDSVERA